MTTNKLGSSASIVLLEVMLAEEVRDVREE